MNRKQLTLILALVAIIGGLGLWLRSRDRAAYRPSEGKMGQKVLGEFDLNAVAHIRLQQDTNQLHLARESDRWVVRERGSYPANFSEVGDLLRKLWDLKIVQPVTVGPSQLGRLELTPPPGGTNSGTLVELKDKDNQPIRAVLLGKKHVRKPASPSPFGGDEGWPDGRYVMVDAKPESVSLVAETFSNVEPKPEQWLNKDFFKVEKVKTVSVTYTNATNSWKLARETETGELRLLDSGPNEKLDSSKVSGIPSALSWPSFNDIVLDPQAEETGLATPTVAVLETFDDFAYTVKVGNRKGEDAYYLAVAVDGKIPKERPPGADETPEDKERLDKEFKAKIDKLNEKHTHEKSLEKWTYLVSKWTVDSLLKDRGALLAEQKDESSATPPADSATFPSSSIPGVIPEIPGVIPPLPAPSSSDAIKPSLPPPPPAPTAELPTAPTTPPQPAAPKPAEPKVEIPPPPAPPAPPSQVEPPPALPAPPTPPQPPSSKPAEPKVEPPVPPAPPPSQGAPGEAAPAAPAPPDQPKPADPKA